MATIQLSLKSRKRKDNTYSLVIRIRHNREYFDILTDTSVLKTQFDSKKSRLTGNPELQLYLEDLLEKYGKRMRKFCSDNLERSFSIQELKQFVLQKPANEVNVYSFWNECIQQLQDSGRGGSARTYKNSLSVISQIIDLNRPFFTIGIKDLIRIEQHLRQRGNNYNSIAVYLRTFRAVCNRAINQDLVSFEWYPFRKYKIRKEKTVPKVLTIQEIQSYFQADFPNDSNLYKVWNIGKLLFLLRGINLRDLIFLKPENIHSDRIIYNRGKTGKLISIKLTPQIEEIISTFQHNRKSLLGLITDELLDKPSSSMESRAQVTKRVNSKLKQIGIKLNLNQILTTYVFRYSFANTARKLGYSKDLIAEALSHQTGNRVTGIYLELFDLEILDKMTQHIESVVTNKLS